MEKIDKKAVIAILSTIAALIAIFAFVTGIFSLPQLLAGTASTGTAGTATSAPQATDTNSSTSPVPTARPPTPTPTQRPITIGTVLCVGGGAHGWNGWSLGSSWHVVNGVLVNDGTDSSGTYSPNLFPPDSCQSQVANIAIKAVIKVDALGYGGYGLDSRGQSTDNGWSGYAFQMYIACYDPSQSQCLAPYIYEVESDPNSNQLATGQYAVGSTFHNYELDLSGNSISAKIDGSTILTATDNRFLDPGQVGLFCKNNTQVEVQSITVIAL